MINLEKTSGLPVQVDEEYHLKYNPPVEVSNNRRFTRTVEEMRDVMMDRSVQVASKVSYEVYGGVHLQEHEQLLKDLHLTYDITITPALMLGKEYNKTYGHYHANIPGSTIAHPELYEVLHGKGLFLLQKMDADFKNVITILAIEGKAGDKIIYPPNYGHIMVNIGDEPLIMANWLSTDYKALYDPIKDKQGMALYVVKGDDGQPTFLKNENYKDQPMMRKMAIPEKFYAEFGLVADEPMYVTAMKNPKILEFLGQPQKYALQLSALSS